MHCANVKKIHFRGLIIIWNVNIITSKDLIFKDIVVENRFRIEIRSKEGCVDANPFDVTLLVLGKQDQDRHHRDVKEERQLAA